MHVGIIYALLSIGAKDGDQIVAPVAALLTNPETRVRRAAAEALGAFGAAARPAIPALRQALEDEDADVRRAWEDALTPGV